MPDVYLLCLGEISLLAAADDQPSDAVRPGVRAVREWRYGYTSIERSPFKGPLVQSPTPPSVHFLLMTQLFLQNFPEI
jgi:hypothetical protein